jgi:bifunctional non-homologous end joining protein LigD
MLASPRHGLPADDDRYGWEFKWDGVRAVTYISDGRIRLVSRNEREMTGSYPELAVLGDQITGPVVLDGEVVAIRKARPDFAALQSRMHVRRPAPQLLQDIPVQLYIFDLLYQDGESLLSTPYTERRQRLDDLALQTGPVRTPPWYRGDGSDILAVSVAHGLEGVVGKPLASHYYPGARREWIKVKNIRHQEVVVGGWKPGAGRRANTIGSLLVGVQENRRLRYAGHVGTGFTETMLADLMRRLRPLGRVTSPFGATVPAQHARGAHWVEPRLVGEIAFSDWTPDLVMRHPSWRGLRGDKNAGQVHPES